MISNKNKSISYEGRKYELFLTFRDAQHICRRNNEKNDRAHHLNFLEIEELIFSGIFHPMGRSRYFIVGKISGKFQFFVLILEIW